MSLVDGELFEGRAAVRAHLEGCASCAGRLETLEHQRALIGDALRVLDADPGPVEVARRAVLARRAGTRRPPSRSEAGSLRARRSWWQTDLARAAGLVLLLAGAASAAIPGSPVRTWIEDRLGPEPEAQPAPEVDAPEPAVPPSAEPAPQEAGIEVAALDGRLRISISGLASGGQVEVILVDGDRSGVYAPAGARFTTTPGGLEAQVDGGWVRVELARTVLAADVEVGGALYLRKSGDRLELPGPGVDSTEAQFRFQVPEARGQGTP